ncbi:MAG: GreA/GreB family elongation factor [Bdellovibrionaceae bacterium]|nr:GreA/GreB family elongation factor [Pseudobdellovibrionaceae bacterium]
MTNVKKELLDELLRKINQELKTLASAETKEEENLSEIDEGNHKPASYLEGAQVKRMKELSETIEAIKHTDVSKKSEKVIMGSLVEADVDGEEQKSFFVLPAASGEKIVIEKKNTFVVTPNSPIGQRLMGKKIGDYFDLPVGSKVHEYEIIDLI